MKKRKTQGKTNYDKNSSKVFNYPQKPLSEGEIRVAKIQPAAPDEPICCTLESIPRASGKPYKALSYAWGDITPTRAIFIDKKQFWLHENLYTALLHFRDRTNVVTLWTDRISIDQSNTSERNVQVQRMGDTYASAEEVVVWLGDADLGSHQLKDLNDIVSRNDILTDEEWNERLSSLLSVVSRPWFHRLLDTLLWLIQNEVGMIVGRKFQQYWGRIETAEDYERFIPQTDLYASFVSGFIAISSFRQHKRKPDDAPFGEVLFVAPFRGRQCLDPRDHLYGVRGMAQHCGTPCTPVDYNLTTEQLFLQKTSEALMLDINALHLVDGEPFNEAQPSWVIDFSRPSKNCDSYLRAPAGSFTAGGSAHFPLRITRESFLPDSRILRFQWGYAFDTVRDSLFANQLTDTEDVPAQQFELVEAFFISWSTQMRTYGNYLDRVQAFWRTLVANLRFDETEFGNTLNLMEWPASDSGVEYEIYMRRASPISGPGDKARSDACRSYSTMANSMLRAIHLFTTERGYFVQVPKRTKSGDLIVVIMGFGMPLILRRMEGKEAYQFIGLTYVHGIMKDEYADEQYEKGKEVQAFDIH